MRLHFNLFLKKDISKGAHGERACVGLCVSINQLKPVTPRRRWVSRQMHPVCVCVCVCVCVRVETQQLNRPQISETGQRAARNEMSELTGGEYVIYA